MLNVGIIQMLPSPCVRNRKVINSLKKSGYNVVFFGVEREGHSSSYFDDVDIVNVDINIPRGSWKKIYLQLVYFFKVVSAIRKKNIDVVYCSDLDGAIPGYFYKLLSGKKIIYIFDVLDSYTLRFNLPSSIKKIIRKFESFFSFRADALIHVDDIRTHSISASKNSNLIVKNTPVLEQLPSLDLHGKENFFLISGGVFFHRGLKEIVNGFLKFNESKGYMLKIIGPLYGAERRYIESISDDSIDYIGSVSSQMALELTSRCRGVFALYEPSSDINIQACPNKLYDGLFNGVPVILNRELLIYDAYKDNNFVVGCDYNDESVNLALKQLANEEHDSVLNQGVIDYRSNNHWDVGFYKVIEFINKKK